MTPLVYTEEWVFCLTLILYLLTSFAGIVCFAMSLVYKLKLRYILPEIVISATSITLFGFLSEAVRIRYLGENPNAFIGSLCFMPVWSVLLIAVVLLALVCLWLFFVVKKRLSSLTAMSVKDALSRISSSLCFYEESGRILLLNEQIDSDCKTLTGERLYDGNKFWSKLCDGDFSEATTIAENGENVIVEFSNGKATCYKRILHELDGKTVYEITGSDISRELELKKELEEKNESLHRMNLRLHKYGEIVEEVTKERETLSTRVKVHGNLGSLILRTKKALNQGEFDRKTLISEWNDIMKLVFDSDDEEDKFSESDKTASSVGVGIFYQGKRPPKGSTAEKIFASAVFECVVNTARHADGSELYAKMTESEKEYSIVLTNNGKTPSGEIKEGGGLSSLRTMTENAGGEMIVESQPSFVLAIKIPKETA